MSTLKIAWLFPDTLYLHGERGNILALERFARLGGFEPETAKIDFLTENFHPMDYDVIFCPPGEIASFPAVVKKLCEVKDELNDFIKSGRVLFVTGTSVAIWCKEVRRFDGSSFSGMGFVDAVAEEKETVYGDDNYFTCTYNGQDIDIIGNQIQMADFVSYEGRETDFFGRLKYGYGNTGKDTNEGFIIKNSVFTNSLGPVLVTNPKLTIEIIRVCAFNRGIAGLEIEFDSELEDKSFDTKKEFILTKTTKLTNCK